MRWPGLDKNHVASDQASSVGTAPRVWFAVEDHSAVTVLGITENLMEIDSKPIQVSNMERTEIRVEGVVKQGIVYRKVHGASLSRGTCGRTLAWGLGLLQRVWKRSSRIRMVVVRGEVETIYFLCVRYESQ